MDDRDKLICDDCGTLNPPNLDACSLCGASLAEERERKEAGSPIVLLITSIGASLVFFFVPGALLYAYVNLDSFQHGNELVVSFPTFALIYGVLWAIGLIVGNKYRPKDEYYMGWDTGYGYTDNPFSLQDDHDRAHMGIGFLFFPMNIVSGLWLATWNAFGLRKR